VAQGKKLSDITTPDDLDALDAEIVAAKSVDPSLSCQEIGDRAGVSHQTVWRRLQRLRKSDWVQQMREDLKTLAPDILKSQQDGLIEGEAKDRAVVGHRLLTGLSVLVTRSEHTGKDGEPLFDFQKMRSAFLAMSDDDKRKFLAELRGGVSGSA